MARIWLRFRVLLVLLTGVAALLAGGVAVSAATTRGPSGPQPGTENLKGPMPEMGGQIPALGSDGSVVGYIDRAEYLSEVTAGSAGLDAGPLSESRVLIRVRSKAGNVVGLMAETGFVTLDEAMSSRLITALEAKSLAAS